MSPLKSPASYRDVLVISVLIIGVCLLTLMPTMYVISHALQWDRARRVLEFIFPPALILSGMAGLLAYQRARERRAMGQDDEAEE
jgi:hypothetical protein